jgi:hypothetical protein
MPTARRVADLYMAKTAGTDRDELRWAAETLESILDQLHDVVDVLDGPSNAEGLSDAYGQAAEASRDIRNDISRSLDKHAKALARLAQKVK